MERVMARSMKVDAHRLMSRKLEDAVLSLGSFAVRLSEMDSQLRAIADEFRELESSGKFLSDDDYLSVTHAVRLSGRTSQFFRALREKGGGPEYLEHFPSGAVYYKRESLLSWIDGLCPPSKSPPLDEGAVEVVDSFSPRVSRCLLNSGLESISSLSGYSRLDLLEIKGLGSKGVSEIERVLARRGLSLKR